MRSRFYILHRVVLFHDRCNARRSFDRDRGIRNVRLFRSTFQQQQQVIGRFYLRAHGHAPRALDVPSVHAPEEFQPYRKIDWWRIRAPSKRLNPPAEHDDSDKSCYCIRFAAANKKSRRGEIPTPCERAGKSGKAIERCVISTFQVAGSLGFKGELRQWDELLRIGE